MSRITRLLLCAAIGPALLLCNSVIAVAAPTATAMSRDEVQPRALPSECNFDVQDWRYTAAWCGEHNGGSFRAIAVCQNEAGVKTHRYGAWRQLGASYAYCQGEEIPTSSGIEKSPHNHT